MASDGTRIGSACGGNIVVTRGAGEFAAQEIWVEAVEVEVGVDWPNATTSLCYDINGATKLRDTLTALIVASEAEAGK